MSRIGRQPIQVPSGVTVAIEPGEVRVNGPKGELSERIHRDIEVEVPQPTRVVVKGISKQLVGETAAIIRKQRPPEPYKGKGIRYEGEYVQRKVGQRASGHAHEQAHEGR